MWPFSSKQIIYTDNVIDLHQTLYEDGSHYNHYIPCVFFDIYLHGTNTKVGKCDLRLGMNDSMYYFGQIGYSISKLYRGNHYAYRACKILFDLAKNKYMQSKLIVTCSPDNIASYKTLVKLSGKLIETCDVPKDHQLYAQNERVKCIFEFKL